MTGDQYFFDYRATERYGPERYLVGEANRDAYDLIQAWPKWPSAVVCVVGPSGGGKTHLCHVWRAKSGAVLMPGKDLTEERLKHLRTQAHVAVTNASECPDNAALFHLYNQIMNNAGTMVLTARQAPSQWTIDLPDLRTRMDAVPVVTIASPGDDLIRGIVESLFEDCGLTVSEPVMSYLLTRITRSYEGIHRTVDALNRVYWQTNAHLTIPAARKVMETLEQR